MFHFLVRSHRNVTKMSTFFNLNVQFIFIDVTKMLEKCKISLRNVQFLTQMLQKCPISYLNVTKMCNFCRKCAKNVQFFEDLWHLGYLALCKVAKMDWKALHIHRIPWPTCTEARAIPVKIGTSKNRLDPPLKRKTLPFRPLALKRERIVKCSISATMFNFFRFRWKQKCCKN